MICVISQSKEKSIPESTVLPNLNPNKNLIKNPSGTVRNKLNIITADAIGDLNKFVSKKHLENLRKQIDEFIEQISQNAKKEGREIDINYIQNIAKKNINKNFAFYSLATGISIFALGILIPKVQYFITKKLYHPYFQKSRSGKEKY